jgi:hypothetical protein
MVVTSVLEAWAWGGLNELRRPFNSSPPKLHHVRLELLPFGRRDWKYVQQNIDWARRLLVALFCLFGHTLVLAQALFEFLSIPFLPK